MANIDPWLLASIQAGYGIQGYDSKGHYFDTSKSSPFYKLPTSLISAPSGLTQYPVKEANKNVMGYATTTTDLKGNTTKNKATENLTGYAVDSNTPGEFDSVDKSTAVVQKSPNSGKRLQSSGNITLWPTLYQETDLKGNTVNSFVIPGYLPAGSLSYTDSGIPYYRNQQIENSSPKQSDLLGPQTAPASAPLPTPPGNQNLSSALNQSDSRRQRNSYFNTFMSGF